MLAEHSSRSWAMQWWVPPYPGYAKGSGVSRSYTLSQPLKDTGCGAACSTLRWATARQRGMVLPASLVPHAMRCYQKAGFDLEPALMATGRPRRHAVPRTPRVRAGAPTELDLVADLDREMRGGPHGPDLTLLLDMGARLLIVNKGPHRGYAVLRREPLIVAATDLATARELLWAALAESPDGNVTVHNLRADQQWAIDVAIHAGLQLAATGLICRRGNTGPMKPYLPHPALL